MSSCRIYARLWPIAAAALIVGLCLSLTSSYAQADSQQSEHRAHRHRRRGCRAHAFMPKTKALIEDQGATFANYFISYPWCCPSRASILRGQYAHNTNIVGNEPPWGGYETFHGLGLEQSTLATWLQAAGYRTAMIGKYLNRYVPEQDGVPPGWDEWYVGGNAHASYDYVLNENGQTVHYGSEPEDYLNDVLTGKATEVIRTSAAAERALLPLCPALQPAQPVGRGTAPRGHVRRRRAAAAALLRRGRRQRQAGLHPRAAAARPGPDRLSRVRVSKAHRIPAGGRRHGREHRRGARRHRPARRHLRHLQLGQRLSHGRAPADRRQGYALRRGHPGADGDARPGRARRLADRGRGRATSISRRPSPRSRPPRPPISSMAARSCRSSRPPTCPGGRRS